jgi:hypothetical protein
MSDFFSRLHDRQPVPNGTRIRLVRMVNDPDPIPAGAIGTVTGGNGSQLYVDWAGGRSLILLVGEDVWEVVR